MSFSRPSAPEVLRYAEERVSDLEVRVERLRSDIYGTSIKQGRETPEGIRYLSHTGHDFRCANADELVDSRWGEIRTLYRAHWADQPGWKDHVFDAMICSEPGIYADAAKLPSNEQWRSGSPLAEVRVLFPDTPAGIQEGERRLRGFAQSYFEFGAQNGVLEGANIKLTIDLFEPSKFPHTRALPKG